MAEYASNGKGNLGVTLGAIGSGLGLLSNHTGLFGMGTGYGSYPGLQFATKESVDNAILLAQKDSEIALLKSEQNTEIKIADVYERIMTRVNADRNAQQEVNAAQGIYNATNNAAMGCMRGQIDALLAMTKTVIPADNVCPRPMDRYNSWVPPLNTETPATLAT